MLAMSSVALSHPIVKRGNQVVQCERLQVGVDQEAVVSLGLAVIDLTRQRLALDVEHVVVPGGQAHQVREDALDRHGVAGRDGGRVGRTGTGW